MNFLTQLFAISQFSPHGFCLAWEPWTLVAYILGDGVTSLAYLLLPIQLVFLLKRSTSGQQIIIRRKNWIIIMFALFIVMCGIDHDFDVLTLWYPYYHLQAIWKVLLGIVSFSTSILVGSAVTAGHDVNKTNDSGINKTSV